MTTRELIRAEIDRVPEERLGDLYRLIQGFRESPVAPSQQGILAKLREIRIDGPPDLAENLDLYLSGEKRVDENVP